MIRMNYDYEPRRHILCVDVKSFFASVEAVARNQHPLEAYIAVVSKPDIDGGLVLAASPLVKKEYGIKTGSRVFDIPRRSKIEIVEPRMGLYLERNAQIVDIFRQYTSDESIHIYSIDESFLDITDSQLLFGSALDIAYKIQRQIWQEYGLVVTIGMGDNPLLAKLALDNDAKKNEGQHFIARWSYEDVPETVWKIDPLTDMWGIGSRTAKKLQALGIQSVYDLSQYDVKKLKKRFGIIGEQLFYHAHGIDQSIISEKYEPVSNSYGKSQILDRDYKTYAEVEVVIREMADQVAARLRNHHAQASLVHLSVGYSDGEVERGFSRQTSIPATNESRKIIQAALFLFDKFYEGYPVRSVGISCGQISHQSSVQLDLFENPEESLQKMKLEKTIDAIRDRYGYSSLVQARSLTEGATAISRSHLIGGHRGGQA